MALYVYVTKECLDDAKKYSLGDEINKFLLKVEKIQSIAHFDNFPPPYLKKRFSRQERLLADYRSIEFNNEEHVVVCFMRIFIRSSSDYLSFLEDPKEFGERKLQPLIDEKELSSFLRKRMNENPIPEKQPLTDYEQQFLYRTWGKDYTQSSGEFVCESELWCSGISDEKMHTRLSNIFEELSNLVESDSNSTRFDFKNISIVYRWLPNLNKLFLAGICKDDEDVKHIYDRYKTILDVPHENISEEIILKNSMRAYPAILLADEDGWLDIERDNEANLALSPEETEVLESVHYHKGKGFPIFINGRAGSGKSTILYHLFADYMYLYLDLKKENTEVGLPVLISSSRELRDRAYKSVCKLLKCNPKWNDRSKDLESLIPEASFKEFHRYLFSILPEDVQKTLFKQCNFVDYGTFRKLWLEKFGNDRKVLKNIGPDISWHIIRTYIKGNNSEEFLDPDDYIDLPRKQKTVSKANYEFVYNNIWNSWYSNLCSEQGMWDDQDLVRYVFNEDLIEPFATAVFCDESQDFTRVELDIIFRLSVFVQRKLNVEEVSSVPLAFAGDPFQTLNPTGFRWDVIQSSFHDKLMDTLGENRNKSIEMNYRELTLNYRSNMHIVRLCNSIQALRAALFDLPSLRPQRTWQSEKNSSFPVWFDREKLSLWENLKEEKDITIIVPCMTNEEQEFVSNNDDLKRIVKVDEEGVPFNVLSPTRAKGLEFKRVVLFGFADYSPENLLTLITSRPDDHDKLLPIEYFINQLYVAASRPKSQLFIIDKKESIEKLWKVASDELKMKSILKSIPNGEKIWFSDMGGYMLGTPESWQVDRGNPEENAKNFEKLGMVEQDYYMLRAAAMSYEELGKHEHANRCKAFALKFEKKLQAAGDLFREAFEAERSLECYWENGKDSFDRILQLGKKFPEILLKIEYKLLYVRDNPSIDGIKQGLIDLIKECNDDTLFKSRVILEPSFKTLINSFIHKLIELNLNSDLNEIVHVFEKLESLGIQVDPKPFGELYYLTGDMEKAIAKWDESHEFYNQDHYVDAKLQCLLNQGDDLDIYNLDDDEINCIVTHYVNEKNYIEALLLTKELGLVDDFNRIFEQIPYKDPEWQQYLIWLMELLSKTGEWDLIVDLITQRPGVKKKQEYRKLLAIFKEKHIEVRNAVVSVCVQNKEFLSLENKVKGSYSDYFKKKLFILSKWRGDLTLEAVGAAFEKAGRWKDVLPFYEKVINDDSFSEDEILFAKKRWIKSKYKQIKRGDTVKGVSDELNKKRIEELKEKSTLYNLNHDKIEDLPFVKYIWQSDLEKEQEVNHNSQDKLIKETPFEEKSKSKDSLEVLTQEDSDIAKKGTLTQSDSSVEISTLGDFRFEFFSEKKRLNIKHKDTGELAVLKGGTHRIESFDIVFEEKSKVFVCSDWNLIGDLRKFDEKGIVHFILKGKKTALRFQF